MASKSIFSLRLSDDIKDRLHDVADSQGTTITALINRYIYQGLVQDNADVGACAESESRVLQPNCASARTIDGRLEELLLQSLHNQRQMIREINDSRDSLRKLQSDVENFSEVRLRELKR